MGTRDLNGLKEVFWNQTVVMAAYLSKFYTEHGLVCLKWVDFRIYKLHWDRVV